MKVDFDMIFRLNAAQKLVAQHCVSDFYKIFHLKAAQNLVAQHSEFSTLRWIKTWLQSPMKYNFDMIFPHQRGSKHGCRALYERNFDMIFHFMAAQILVAEHYEIDFDMIFRSNAAQNLVAEHYIIEFYMIFQ